MAPVPDVDRGADLVSQLEPPVADERQVIVEPSPHAGRQGMARSP